MHTTFEAMEQEVDFYLAVYVKDKGYKQWKLIVSRNRSNEKIW